MARASMPQKTSAKILLIIAVLFITVSVSLIIVPYYIFPEFYTPKSNPYLGYTTPNTLEGWIILIAALILLALGTILLVLCGLRQEEESRLPDVNMGLKY
jgi:hypothetical protein